MARWPKGTSGNPLGRPRGVSNKVRRDAKALALRLVSDARYVERLQARLLSGRLGPAVETMLWFFAHGKPAEQLQVTNTTELPPLRIEIRDATDADAPSAN